MENHFHERLYDLEAKPPADAWEGIVAKLARRRRRRMLWWFAASSAVLLLCALILMLDFRTDTPRADDAPTSPKTALSANTNSVEGARASESDARDKFLILQDESGRSGVAHAPKWDAVDGAGAAATNLPLPSASGMTKTAAIAVPPVLPVKSAANTFGKDELPAPSTRAPEVAEVPRPAPAPVPGALPMPVLPRLPLRPSSVAAGSQRPLAVTASVSSAMDKPRKSKTLRYCYDFERKPTAWMLDLYGGPALGLTDFRATNPEYDAYALRRQNTEQDVVGFNVGMRLSRVFNRFLALRGGLNYEHLTQRFSFVDERYKRETYTTSTQFINGQWVTVTDTLVEFGLRSQTVYNRYRYLDIPLMIGMEMRSGRSGLSVQAGAAVNLLFMAEGVMLAPNNQTVGFNTGSNQIFKVRAGMSAVASAQCFYYLNPNLRAFAEVAYRQPFAPITQSAYPIQQWQGSAALRLGFTRLME